MNLSMPALKRALERAGFADVRTLLSSGNAVFAAKDQKPETLEGEIETILTRELGKSFMTFVRPLAKLRQIIEEDPYSEFRLRPGAKRVVTFLRKKLPAARLAKLELPIELEGARILAVRDREALSAYVPSARGPVFMTLLEKTFGKEITTRTWDTVKKAAPDLL
jgi:uncharacterized protein (DUF1697 family)